MENGTHTLDTTDTSEISKSKNIENEEKSPPQKLLHDEVIDALIKEAEKRGLSDCQLDITSGSTKGDNFMGILAIVKVTGKNINGEKVQLNWIAKAAPQTDLYRSMLKIDIAYATEVYMYKLFDQLDEFQAEKKLLQPFNAHPKFVLSYLEPYKESFVMEDLKAEGYVLRDRKQPLDINHVKHVMREYGKFHAISFALRDQKPELFAKLAKEREEKIFVTDDEEHIQNMIKYQDNFNNKLLALLNEESDAEVIKSLKYYCKDPVHFNMNTITETNEYSVIGHGDCWTNNFIWKYEDAKNPEIPTKVCILDWQLSRYGSVALDLSYFFYACTTQEFREKHYDKMIQLYYYSLCSHLVEMGSDPERMFPFSALINELKHHCTFGFYMGTMVLHIMISDNTEMPEFSKTDNVDQFMESFDYKSVNEHLFNERARGVILHMHQKGYFDYLKDK
ncbi:uncharacterized protein [Onthophagus taurus]|uniref:uncharacterized protein n=1 Tax=Onthophagus taurus TaxID=166361 RepID=UPI0039BE3850